MLQVLLHAAGGDHRLSGADDVLRLELQRVQAHSAGEFVEGRLDREFEGTAGKVELRVRCVSGRPSGSWKQDD
ncbi:hypothetical protein HEP84_57405 [Streptomyces sp. RLB1-33]